MLYHPERGPLTVSGMVGGDAHTGYITKGDTNRTSVCLCYDACPPTWIVGISYRVRRPALRLPFMGYLPLWAT